MDKILSPLVEKIVDMALEEDVGRGDVTTRLTVPDGLETTGRIIAREDLVMSGGDLFAMIMQRVDPDIDVQIDVVDGQGAAVNDVLGVVKGPVASLLMGERVALNFLQRICGVATLTRRFVDRLPRGSTVRITDTRKTTPGLRLLERRAVLDGGGQSHRVDLAGGVLIKENHIVAAGSLAKAVRRCKQSAPHPLKVEVEVRNEAELNEALEAGADAILLDNMTVDELKRCAEKGNGRAFLEASGGVNLDNVALIAATGVDAISVGALTHSAPAADISFLLDTVS
jgi:nicotinate-nucleotide pyrophosphorylase (carboxylating)